MQDSEIAKRVPKTLQECEVQYLETYEQLNQVEQNLKTARDYLDKLNYTLTAKQENFKSSKETLSATETELLEDLERISENILQDQAAEERRITEQAIEMLIEEREEKIEAAKAEKQGLLEQSQELESLLNIPSIEKQVTELGSLQQQLEKKLAQLEALPQEDQEKINSYITSQNLEETVKQTGILSQLVGLSVDDKHDLSLQELALEIQDNNKLIAKETNEINEAIKALTPQARELFKKITQLEDDIQQLSLAKRIQVADSENLPLDDPQFVTLHQALQKYPKEIQQKIVDLIKVTDLDSQLRQRNDEYVKLTELTNQRPIKEKLTEIRSLSSEQTTLISTLEKEIGLLEKGSLELPDTTQQTLARAKYEITQQYKEREQGAREQLSTLENDKTNIEAQQFKELFNLVKQVEQQTKQIAELKSTQETLLKAEEELKALYDKFKQQEQAKTTQTESTTAPVKEQPYYNSDDPNKKALLREINHNKALRELEESHQEKISHLETQVEISLAQTAKLQKENQRLDKQLEELQEFNKRLQREALEQQSLNTPASILNLADEMAIAEYPVLKSQLAGLNEQVAELEQQVKAKEAALTKAEKEKKAAETQHQKVFETEKEVNQKLQTELEQTKQQASSDKQQAQQELEKVKQEISTLTTSKQELESLLMAVKKEAAEAGGNNTKLNEQVAELQQQVKEKGKKLEQAETDKNEAATQHKAAFKAAEQTKQQALTEKQEEIEQLRKQIQENNKVIEQTKEEAGQKLQTVQQQVKELNSSKRDLENQLKEANKKAEKAGIKNTTLNEEVTKLNQQLEENTKVLKVQKEVFEAEKLAREKAVEHVEAAKNQALEEKQKTLEVNQKLQDELEQAKQKTATSLAEVNAKVKGLESEKEGLTTQLEIANKKAEEVEGKNTTLNIEVEKLTKELTTNKEALTKAENARNEAATQHEKALETEQQAKQTAQQKLKSAESANQKLQTELEQTKEAVEETASKNTLLNEQVAGLEKQVIAKEEALARVKEEQEQVKVTNTALNEEVINLQQQLDEKSKVLQHAETDKNEAATQHKAVLEAAEQTKQQALTEKQEVQQKLGKAQSELSKLGNEKEKLVEQLKIAEDKVKAGGIDNAAKQKEITKLQNQLTTKDQELESAAKVLETAKQETSVNNQKLNEQVANLQKQLEEKNQALEQAEREQAEALRKQQEALKDKEKALEGLKLAHANELKTTKEATEVTALGQNASNKVENTALEELAKRLAALETENIRLKEQLSNQTSKQTNAASGNSTVIPERDSNDDAVQQAAEVKSGRKGYGPEDVRDSQTGPDGSFKMARNIAIACAILTILTGFGLFALVGLVAAGATAHYHNKMQTEKRQIAKQWNIDAGLVEPAEYHKQQMEKQQSQVQEIAQLKEQLASGQQKLQQMQQQMQPLLQSGGSPNQHPTSSTENLKTNWRNQYLASQSAPGSTRSSSI